MIPKRRKPPRMNTRQSERIRCAGHLQWIRGCECLIAGRYGTAEVHGGLMASLHVCEGNIQAAHVRSTGDGGMGLKPGDHLTVPLCAAAHAEQHQIGEPAFERKYGINLAYSAGAAWVMSPAGKRYRREMEMVDG